MCQDGKYTLCPRNGKPPQSVSDSKPAVILIPLQGLLHTRLHGWVFKCKARGLKLAVVPDLAAVGVIQRRFFKDRFGMKPPGNDAQRLPPLDDSSRLSKG